MIYDWQRQLGCEEVKSRNFNLSSAITRFNEIRGMKAQVAAETAEVVKRNLFNYKAHYMNCHSNLQECQTMFHITSCSSQ